MITKLQSEYFLSEGKSVWFMPTQTHSPWETRLDWYMNFQIGKSDNRHQILPPPALLRICKEEGFEFQKILATADAPKMVATSGLLPNRLTVALPVRDPIQWASRLKEVWVQLGKPDSRVFLPHILDFDNFEKIWRSVTENIEVCETLLR